MQIFFGTNSILFAIGGLLMTRSWLGLIVGFLIGMFVDRNNAARRTGQSSQRGSGQQSSFDEFIRNTYQQQQRPASTPRQFSDALLILSAEVMKADGKVLRAELDFVKQFLVNQFGRQYAPTYLQQLKTYLNQSSNLEQTCYNFRGYLPHQQKHILVQYLFGIAQSDGSVSNTELNTIQRIALLLGVPNYEFDQLKAMFWKDSADAYSTLGIQKSATDQDVKAAYRKLAREHHPDKFASMGEQHQKAANDKFQKIQEAYEVIKKERSI